MTARSRSTCAYVNAHERVSQILDTKLLSSVIGEVTRARSGGRPFDRSVYLRCVRCGATNNNKPFVKEFYVIEILLRYFVYIFVRSRK